MDVFAAIADPVRRSLLDQLAHNALVTEPLHEVTTWSAGLAGEPDAAARTAARPPVASHQLDALDLEVRRTVRERTDTPGKPHTGASGSTETGESA